MLQGEKEKTDNQFLVPKKQSQSEKRSGEENIFGQIKVKNLEKILYKSHIIPKYPKKNFVRDVL